MSLFAWSLIGSFVLIAAVLFLCDWGVRRWEKEMDRFADLAYETLRAQFGATPVRILTLADTIDPVRTPLAQTYLAVEQLHEEGVVRCFSKPGPRHQISYVQLIGLRRSAPLKASSELAVA